jgi:hypothetical protein
MNMIAPAINSVARALALPRETVEHCAAALAVERIFPIDLEPAPRDVVALLIGCMIGGQDFDALPGEVRAFMKLPLTRVARTYTSDRAQLAQNHAAKHPLWLNPVELETLGTAWALEMAAQKSAEYRAGRYSTSFVSLGASPEGKWGSVSIYDHAATTGDDLVTWNLWFGEPIAASVGVTRLVSIGGHVIAAVGGAIDIDPAVAVLAPERDRAAAAVEGAMR